MFAFNLVPFVCRTEARGTLLVNLLVRQLCPRSHAVARGRPGSHSLWAVGCSDTFGAWPTLAGSYPPSRSATRRRPPSCSRSFTTNSGLPQGRPGPVPLLRRADGGAGGRGARDLREASGDFAPTT